MNNLLAIGAIVLGVWFIFKSRKSGEPGETVYYATSFEALKHITTSRPYVAWSPNGWYVTDVLQGE